MDVSGADLADDLEGVLGILEVGEVARVEGEAVAGGAVKGGLVAVGEQRGGEDAVEGLEEGEGFGGGCGKIAGVRLDGLEGCGEGEGGHGL